MYNMEEMKSTMGQEIRQKKYKKQTPKHKHMGPFDVGSGNPIHAV